MIKSLFPFKSIIFFVLTLNISLFSQVVFENNLMNDPVQKILPVGYENTPGTNTFLGPMATSERTYQQLISSTVLTDFVDKQLTSISYRIPSNATIPWPVSTITFESFDIYLSDCVNPADRSLTFANNILGPQTLVRSGELIVESEIFPSGGSPNDFGVVIQFDTPWEYTGGNLLIEIRHTGFSGTSRSLDAIGTSTQGYGTLYSACWIGSYTGVSGNQGNFCILNLQASESLNIQELKKETFTLYPNPVQDVLRISSPLEVYETKIYSLNGMLLSHNKHSSGLNQIEVNNFAPATYILEILHDDGVLYRKFIKN